MGADPGARGLANRQTTLNCCIGRMQMLKNLDAHFDILKPAPDSPEALDFIRSQTNGIFGHTLDQQRTAIKKLKKNSLFPNIEQSIEALMRETITKNMSLDNMRVIAKLLLEYGADPNAEHKPPLEGYTPLMLSAEIDERNLFEVMLSKKGNPAKSYINPRTDKDVDC